MTIIVVDDHNKLELADVTARFDLLMRFSPLPAL